MTYQKIEDALKGAGFVWVDHIEAYAYRNIRITVRRESTNEGVFTVTYYEKPLLRVPIASIENIEWDEKNLMIADASRAVLFVPYL